MRTSDHDVSVRSSHRRISPTRYLQAGQTTMIRIGTLSKASNEDILNCFNLSFSDYSIPFKLSLQQLEKKLSAEDINKEISIGAFKDQELIGFVLHGDRECKNHRVAYNAGTGVVPHQRGQRLTRRMYDFIKPNLESKGFEEVILEVISSNISAIKSYEKVGFKRERVLNCFKGELAISKINQNVDIEKFDNTRLSKLNIVCEIKPSWQNSNETIKNMKSDALVLTARIDSVLGGYIVINKTNNRILQIAVKKEMRRRYIGSSLLKYLADKISNETSIINVDNNYASALNFLQNMNLQQSLTQDEMKLKIARR